MSADPLAGIDTDSVEHSRARLSEHVVAALREAILSGALPPGTSLREVALAERFSVSRNTVREAIRSLVTEGLVAHLMHRGAVVAQPTPEDVVDIYRARVAIEVAAVGRLPEVGAAALPEALGALREAQAGLEAAVAAGDTDAITEADLAFHGRLVALAGSPRLDAFYAHLQGELRLLLLFADRDNPDEGKVDDHRHLLDLAVRGDVEGLRAALASHVESAEAVLLRVLAARSSVAPPH